MAADARLVADWLAGRSLARGLPSPLPDRGGLRVDTATEAEIARWVFAGPDEAITALTRAVRLPGYLVKCGGSAAELTPLLAPGWVVESEIS